MTIDWQLPVETDEKNPRPVTVLSTNAPDKFHPVVFVASTSGYYVSTLDGSSVLSLMRNGDPSTLRIRNVAPKPVRHEVYIALYDDGSFGASKLKDAIDFVKQDRVECRRVVWNSDGSPVDDTVSKEEYDRVCAERDSAQINASNAVRDFKELAQGSQEIVDGLKAELAQEKRNVSRLTAEIARLNALNGAEQKTVEKSCDNCANGPRHSEKCAKKLCSWCDTNPNTWANWEQKR